MKSKTFWETISKIFKDESLKLQKEEHVSKLKEGKWKTEQTVQVKNVL